MSSRWTAPVQFPGRLVVVRLKTVKLSRIFARVILAAAFLLSIAVAYRALNSGQLTEGTWATIAGALAVIASVAAAWTSQKSLELQQDAQQPYPYPSVDARSRYGLLQLRITNTGGLAAHNIKLIWDKPLLNSKGEPFVFTKQEGAPDVAVLLPGDSASRLIDGAVQFFPAVKDANYSGYVEFQDGSGKRSRHKFHISFEDLRSSLYYDEEESKTHYELQKVPAKIDGLIRELKGIRRTLEADGDVPGRKTLSE
jgi:hypothetical protein